MYHTLRELTLLECHYLDNRSMIQIKLILNVCKLTWGGESKHRKNNLVF